MRNIALIYPYIPHYRKAVLTELQLALRPSNLIILAGSNTIDKSIKEVDTDKLNIQHTPVYTTKGITFQLGILKTCLDKNTGYLIFLGDPHFVLTWLYSIIARLRGKRVFFWTHGWLAQKPGIKDRIRNSFYRLADGLLLYGNRAKSIGVSYNFPPESLSIIYNSLDYDLQKSTREQFNSSEYNQKNDLISTLADRCYFACVARLTTACQFDIAIKALAILRRQSKTIPLVLIGDGPETDKLKALANDLQVKVLFLGEQYSEDLIGYVLFNSRAVVSPGKVGLTAMHALAYGTPVITHGDFSTQMPEYEAITPGKTGDFFRKGDAQDLANTLLRWHNKPRTKEEREACIQIIEEKYNPRTQARLIRDAINKY